MSTKAVGITQESLEQWLRKWAREYGEAPPLEDEGDAACSHPIARAMQHAPRSRSTVVHYHRRDGSARRARMAAAAGMEGMRLVPMAYVDHVPCTETRPDLRTPWHVSGRRIPAEVQAIQRCVMGLVRESPEWGHALQVHYCRRGSRAEKEAWLSAYIGRAVTPRAYRTLLEQARVAILVLLAQG